MPKVQHPALIFVLAGFFCTCDTVYSQDEFVGSPAPVMHERRDFSLEIGPQYINHPNAYPRVVGSLNSMVFLGEHVSLNASVAGGEGYFHFGPGILGVPFIGMLGVDALWVEPWDLEGWFVWAIMMGFAFENVNFHIPVTGHFEISPYFSLLRIKYIQEGYGGGNSTWNANLIYGVRLNIFTSDRFFVAPYAEMTRDWGHGSDGVFGVNGGINAGFYFRH